MSNYRWVKWPAAFAHYREEIIVGGETVNGTGEVVLKTYKGDEGAYFTLTIAEARALARMLMDAATDADLRRAEE